MAENPMHPAFGVIAPSLAERRIQRSAAQRTIRKCGIALAGLALAGPLAVSLGSAAEPSAKMVRCGAESCVRISGQRTNPAAAVRINGRAVHAEGRRRWKVDLPVDTVRDWSRPHARTIEVGLHDPDRQDAILTSIALPVGLLGGTTDLASLVIRAD